MTTPQAILTGFALVALAVASLPYSNGLISPAYAADKPMKIALCTEDGESCATLTRKTSAFRVQTYN